MKASQIPDIQWVARLRDILTGKVLKTFQDLSDGVKASFAAVRDRLLGSQNLMAESYRRFLHITPSADPSFADVSFIKTLFNYSVSYNFQMSPPFNNYMTSVTKTRHSNLALLIWSHFC